MSRADRFVCRLFVALSLIAALAGCGGKEPITQPTQGETFGRIFIDSPEVFGRERLARDRLAQQQWLEAQLQAVDSADYAGFQGAAQTRRFDSRRFRAGADASAGAALGIEETRSEIDAVGRNAELEELRFQIERRRLEQELQALNSSESDDDSDDDDSSTDDSGASGDTGNGGSAAVLDRLLGTETLSADAAQLPGTDIAATSLVDRPQDVFLAKLAFRERIRQELLENNLDDSHDLDGSTLYRLSFDATVFPTDDTSAWAVVEVELKDPYRGEELCSINESPDLLSIYNRWADSLELRLNDEVARLTELALASHRRDEGLTDLERRFLAQLRPVVKTSTGRMSLKTVTSYYEGLRTNGTADPNRVSPEKFEGDVARIARELVRKEYQHAINPPNDSSFVTIEDRDNRLQVCEGSGQTIANFCKALVRRRQAGAISAYAITPKVTTERISQVAASRSARELALGLAADAGPVQFQTAFEKARVLDAATHSILRQPLVVGFSEVYDRASLEVFKAQDMSELGTVRDLIDRAENAASAAESAKGQAFRAKKQAEDAASGTESCACDHNQDQDQDQGSKKACSHTPDCRPHQTSGDRGFPKTSSYPVFGWILGPRFKARMDEAGHDFRFLPRPETLAAVVSVPAWWSRVEVQVTTCWVTENAVPLNGGRVCGDHARRALPAVSAPEEPVEPQILFDSSASYPIRLAGNIEAVTTALIPSRRQPSASIITGGRMEVGRSGRLVLVGSELWRNPTIMLGAQKADDVQILPDMQGVIASFDSVLRPAAWTRSQRVGREDVWLWTSEGRSYAGSAEIHLAPSTSTPGPQSGFTMAVPGTHLAVRNGGAEITVRFSSTGDAEAKGPQVVFGTEGAEISQVESVATGNNTCEVARKGVEWQLTWKGTEPKKKLDCHLELSLRNVAGDAVTFTSYRVLEKQKIRHTSSSLLVEKIGGP